MHLISLYIWHCVIVHAGMLLTNDVGDVDIIQGLDGDRECITVTIAPAGRDFYGLM